MVGIEPREPAHALVERPGHRPAGRGALRARRGLRRAVGADGPADPRRDRALRRPARAGLQPVRARRARHRARSPPVRAARRSGQGFAPDDPEYVPASPAAFGHGLCRVGARPVARRIGVLGRDRDRSGNRRDVRAQPVEQRVRFPRRLRRSRRPADRMDRRPAGVPGAKRHARQSRRAGRRTRRCRGGWAPASTPAAPCRRRSSSNPAETVEIVFLLGQAATAADAQVADRPLPRGRSRRGPAPRRRPLGRRARHGPGENAGPVDGPHAESLAALPDARVPRLGAVGVLPGERRLRLPRPAPGRNGARAVAPGNDARASAARRGPAVRRRRRPALVDAAVRTRGAHPHLRRPDVARLRHRTLCRDDGRRRGAGRAPAVPRRPGARRRRARRLLPAHARGRERIALRALRPRARPESRRRRARPAADRHRRLERRHEPGRRAGPGGERLARLVPARDAGGVRAARRRRAAKRRAPRTGSRTPRASAARSSARPGTGTGTGAAISTTARRSARPRATSAGSIRSRNPGA